MQLQFDQSILGNGVTVVTARMDHVGSAALGIWVKVGGRYESRRLSGVSHFIEHLLFKGTHRRSAREISQEIEGRGGYLNAFTQEESTCYYARIASDHLADAFDVLVDMYRNPRFDAKEIDKERGVIVEEIMMYRDRPNNLVEEMLGELLWAGHPLGRALIGTPDTISRMTRSEIVRFKQSHYVAGNTVVALAGNLNHQDCVSMVSRTLGRMPATRNRPQVSVTRGTRQGAVAMLQKDIEQSHLAMGIRLFGRHDPRRYPLKLLSVILGENMSSRLFQVVRERHGLAYSVHSSAHLFEDTGALCVHAGLDRERTGKAIDLILRELRQMKERPVSPRELRRAKDYAIGQLRISLESTTNQMMYVGENLVGYKHFTQPDVVIRRLEAVTADDVHRLAREILNPRRASAALIVPGEAGRLKPLLQRAISRLG